MAGGPTIKEYTIKITADIKQIKSQLDALEKSAQGIDIEGDIDQKIVALKESLNGSINGLKSDIKAMSDSLGKINTSSLVTELSAAGDRIDGLGNNIGSLLTQVGNLQIALSSIGEGSKFSVFAEQMEASFSKLSDTVIDAVNQFKVLGDAFRAIQSGNMTMPSDDFAKAIQHRLSLMNQLEVRIQMFQKLQNMGWFTSDNKNKVKNAETSAQNVLGIINTINQANKTLSKHGQSIDTDAILAQFGLSKAGINVARQQVRDIYEAITEEQNEQKKRMSNATPLENAIRNRKDQKSGKAIKDDAKKVASDAREQVAIVEKEIDDEVERSNDTGKYRDIQARFRVVWNEDGKHDTKSVVDSLVNKIQKDIVDNVNKNLKNKPIRIPLGYMVDLNQAVENKELETGVAEEMSDKRQNESIIKSINLAVKLNTDQLKNDINTEIQNINSYLSGDGAPKIKVHVESDMSDIDVQREADKVTDQIQRNAQDRGQEGLTLSSPASGLSLSNQTGSTFIETPVVNVNAGVVNIGGVSQLIAGEISNGIIGGLKSSGITGGTTTASAPISYDNSDIERRRIESMLRINGYNVMRKDTENELGGRELSSANASALRKRQKAYEDFAKVIVNTKKGISDLEELDIYKEKDYGEDVEGKERVLARYSHGVEQEEFQRLLKNTYNVYNDELERRVKGSTIRDINGNIISEGLATKYKRVVGETGKTEKYKQNDVTEWQKIMIDDIEKMRNRNVNETSILQYAQNKNNQALIKERTESYLKSHPDVARKDVKRTDIAKQLMDEVYDRAIEQVMRYDSFSDAAELKLGLPIKKDTIGDRWKTITNNVRGKVAKDLFKDSKFVTDHNNQIEKLEKEARIIQSELSSISDKGIKAAKESRLAEIQSYLKTNGRMAFLGTLTGEIERTKKNAKDWETSSDYDYSKIAEAENKKKFGRRRDIPSRLRTGMVIDEETGKAANNARTATTVSQGMQELNKAIGNIREDYADKIMIQNRITEQAKEQLADMDAFSELYNKKVTANEPEGSFSKQDEEKLQDLKNRVVSNMTDDVIDSAYERIESLQLERNDLINQNPLDRASVPDMPDEEYEAIRKRKLKESEERIQQINSQIEQENETITQQRVHLLESMEMKDVYDYVEKAHARAEASVTESQKRGRKLFGEARSTMQKMADEYFESGVEANPEKAKKSHERRVKDLKRFQDEMADLESRMPLRDNTGTYDTKYLSTYEAQRYNDLQRSIKRLRQQERIYDVVYGKGGDEKILERMQDTPVKSGTKIKGIDISAETAKNYVEALSATDMSREEAAKANEAAKQVIEAAKKKLESYSDEDIAQMAREDTARDIANIGERKTAVDKAIKKETDDYRKRQLKKESEGLASTLEEYQSQEDIEKQIQVERNKLNNLKQKGSKASKQEVQNTEEEIKRLEGKLNVESRTAELTGQLNKLRKEYQVAQDRGASKDELSQIEKQRQGVRKELQRVKNESLYNYGSISRLTNGGYQTQESGGTTRIVGEYEKEALRRENEITDRLNDVLMNGSSERTKRDSKQIDVRDILDFVNSVKVRDSFMTTDALKKAEQDLADLEYVEQNGELTEGQQQAKRALEQQISKTRDLAVRSSKAYVQDLRDTLAVNFGEVGTKFLQDVDQNEAFFDSFITADKARWESSDASAKIQYWKEEEQIINDVVEQYIPEQKIQNLKASQEEVGKKISEIESKQTGTKDSKQLTELESQRQDLLQQNATISNALSSLQEKRRAFTNTVQELFFAESDIALENPHASRDRAERSVESILRKLQKKAKWSEEDLAAIKELDINQLIPDINEYFDSLDTHTLYDESHPNYRLGELKQHLSGIQTDENGEIITKREGLVKTHEKKRREEKVSLEATLKSAEEIAAQTEWAIGEQAEQEVTESIAQIEEIQKRAKEISGKRQKDKMADVQKVTQEAENKIKSLQDKRTSLQARKVEQGNISDSEIKSIESHMKLIDGMIDQNEKEIEKTNKDNIEPYTDSVNRLNALQEKKQEIMDSVNEQSNKTSSEIKQELASVNAQIDFYKQIVDQKTEKDVRKALNSDEELNALINEQSVAEEKSKRLGSKIGQNKAERRQIDNFINAQKEYEKYENEEMLSPLIEEAKQETQRLKTLYNSRLRQEKEWGVKFKGTEEYNKIIEENSRWEEVIEKGTKSSIFSQRKQDAYSLMQNAYHTLKGIDSDFTKKLPKSLKKLSGTLIGSNVFEKRIDELATSSESLNNQQSALNLQGISAQISAKKREITETVINDLEDSVIEAQEQFMAAVQAGESDENILAYRNNYLQALDKYRANGGTTQFSYENPASARRYNLRSDEYDRSSAEYQAIVQEGVSKGLSIDRRKDGSVVFYDQKSLSKIKNDDLKKRIEDFTKRYIKSNKLNVQPPREGYIGDVTAEQYARDYTSPTLLRLQEEQKNLKERRAQLQTRLLNAQQTQGKSKEVAEIDRQISAINKEIYDETGRQVMAVRQQMIDTLLGTDLTKEIRTIKSAIDDANSRLEKATASGDEKTIATTTKEINGLQTTLGRLQKNNFKGISNKADAVKLLDQIVGEFNLYGNTKFNLSSSLRDIATMDDNKTWNPTGELLDRITEENKELIAYVSDKFNIDYVKKFTDNYTHKFQGELKSLPELRTMREALNPDVEKYDELVGKVRDKWTGTKKFLSDISPLTSKTLASDLSSRETEASLQKKLKKVNDEIERIDHEKSQPIDRMPSETNKAYNTRKQNILNELDRQRQEQVTLQEGINNQLKAEKEERERIQSSLSRRISRMPSEEAIPGTEDLNKDELSPQEYNDRVVEQAYRNLFDAGNKYAVARYSKNTDQIRTAEDEYTQSVLNLLSVDKNAFSETNPILKTIKDGIPSFNKNMGYLGEIIKGWEQSDVAALASKNQKLVDSVKQAKDLDAAISAGERNISDFEGMLTAARKRLEQKGAFDRFANREIDYSKLPSGKMPTSQRAIDIAAQREAARERYKKEVKDDYKKFDEETASKDYNEWRNWYYAEMSEDEAILSRQIKELTKLKYKNDGELSSLNQSRLEVLQEQAKAMGLTIGKGGYVESKVSKQDFFAHPSRYKLPTITTEKALAAGFNEKGTVAGGQITEVTGTVNAANVSDISSSTDQLLSSILSVITQIAGELGVAPEGSAASESADKKNKFALPRTDMTAQEKADFYNEKAKDIKGGLANHDYEDLVKTALRNGVGFEEVSKGVFRAIADVENDLTKQLIKEFKINEGKGKGSSSRLSKANEALFREVNGIIHDQDGTKHTDKEKEDARVRAVKAGFGLSRKGNPVSNPERVNEAKTSEFAKTHGIDLSKVQSVYVNSSSTTVDTDKVEEPKKESTPKQEKSGKKTGGSKKNTKQKDQQEKVPVDTPFGEGTTDINKAMRVRIKDSWKKENQDYWKTRQELAKKTAKERGYTLDEHGYYVDPNAPKKEPKQTKQQDSIWGKLDALESISEIKDQKMANQINSWIKKQKNPNKEVAAYISQLESMLNAEVEAGRLVRNKKGNFSTPTTEEDKKKTKPKEEKPTVDQDDVAEKVKNILDSLPEEFQGLGDVISKAIVEAINSGLSEADLQPFIQKKIFEALGGESGEGSNAKEAFEKYTPKDISSITNPEELMAEYDRILKAKEQLSSLSDETRKGLSDYGTSLDQAISNIEAELFNKHDYIRVADSWMSTKADDILEGVETEDTANGINNIEQQAEEATHAVIDLNNALASMKSIFDSSGKEGLMQALNGLTNAQLKGILSDPKNILDSKGVSKLKKSELIDRIYGGIDKGTEKIANEQKGVSQDSLAKDLVKFMADIDNASMEKAAELKNELLSKYPQLQNNKAFTEKLNQKKSIYSSLMAFENTPENLLKGRGSYLHFTDDNTGVHRKEFEEKIPIYKSLGYDINPHKPNKHGTVNADIVPIEGKAITSPEEIVKVLFADVLKSVDQSQDSSGVSDSLKDVASSGSAAADSLRDVANAGNAKVDFDKSLGFTMPTKEEVGNMSKEELLALREKIAAARSRQNVQKDETGGLGDFVSGLDGSDEAIDAIGNSASNATDDVRVLSNTLSNLFGQLSGSPIEYSATFGNNPSSFAIESSKSSKQVEKEAIKKSYLENIWNDPYFQFHNHPSGFDMFSPKDMKTIIESNPFNRNGSQLFGVLGKNTMRFFDFIGLSQDKIQEFGNDYASQLNTLYEQVKAKKHKTKADENADYYNQSKIVLSKLLEKHGLQDRMKVFSTKDTDDISKFLLSAKARTQQTTDDMVQRLLNATFFNKSEYSNDSFNLKRQDVQLILEKFKNRQLTGVQAHDKLSYILNGDNTESIGKEAELSIFNELLKKNLVAGKKTSDSDVKMWADFLKRDIEERAMTGEEAFSWLKKRNKGWFSEQTQGVDPSKFEEIGALSDFIDDSLDEIDNLIDQRLAELEEKKQVAEKVKNDIGKSQKKEKDYTTLSEKDLQSQIKREQGYIKSSKKDETKAKHEEEIKKIRAELERRQKAEAQKQQLMDEVVSQAEESDIESQNETDNIIKRAKKKGLGRKNKKQIENNLKDLRAKYESATTDEDREKWQEEIWKITDTLKPNAKLRKQYGSRPIEAEKSKSEGKSNVQQPSVEEQKLNDQAINANTDAINNNTNAVNEDTAEEKTKEFDEKSLPIDTQVMRAVLRKAGYDVADSDNIDAKWTNRELGSFVYKDSKYRGGLYHRYDKNGDSVVREADVVQSDYSQMMEFDKRRRKLFENSTRVQEFLDYNPKLFKQGADEIIEAQKKLSAIKDINIWNEDGSSAFSAEQIQKMNDELTKQMAIVDKYRSRSVGKVELEGWNIKGDFSTVRSEMEAYVASLNNGSVAIEKFSKNEQELTYTLRTSDNMLETHVLSVDKTGAMYDELSSVTKYLNPLQQAISGVGNKFRELLNYFVASTSIYEFINMIRRAVSMVTEMDTAMTNLHKVAEGTTQEFANFQKESFDIARQTGSTATSVVDAATEWARLGYNLQDAGNLSKASVVYSNVGELEAGEATTDLVSALKAFNIEADNAMHVVDVMNEIGNNYAISSGQLGEVIEKSAAALTVSGDDLEHVTAMAAAMNEVVQDSSVTGSTLKVVGLRLRGAKTELADMDEDTEGMVTSTSKLRDKIMGLTNVNGKGGFDIMLDPKTFKSTYDIIKGIAEVWDDMAQIDQAALLELIAGKNRAQGVSALIQNFDTAERALKDAYDAEGSAEKENEKYIDSIQGKMAKFQNQLQEMANTTIESDSIKMIVDLGTDALSIVTQLVDRFGGLQTILSGIAAIFMQKNGLGKH